MARPYPSLSVTQKRWLLRPGALTQGLRAGGELSLRVLAEGASRPRPDEAAALRLAPGERAWIREVCMSINEIPCVVARSVTSFDASRVAWRGIRSLGSRPLADLLYDDKQVSRQPFETSRVTSRQGIWLALRRQPGLLQTPLLARRSVFVRQQQALLVVECFLPAFWRTVQPAMAS